MSLELMNTKNKKALTMSRSKNETSVPNQRGRKQLLKGKRLSQKRVRKMPLDSDFNTLKRVAKSVQLDK